MLHLIFCGPTDVIIAPQKLCTDRNYEDEPNSQVMRYYFKLKHVNQFIQLNPPDLQFPLKFAMEKVCTQFPKSDEQPRPKGQKYISVAPLLIIALLSTHSWVFKSSCC